MLDDPRERSFNKKEVVFQQKITRLHSLVIDSKGVEIDELLSFIDNNNNNVKADLSNVVSLLEEKGVEVIEGFTFPTTGIEVNEVIESAGFHSIFNIGGSKK